MKVQLLPSSFGSDGAISQRQHLSCLIIDDRVAFDAGSLAFSCSEKQRASVRDIFISHAHLDHIAGLPIFIDDLFATLAEPVRIHASAAMIDVLERDIFNWSIYPRFSELENSNGKVIEYHPFELGGPPVRVAHLSFEPFEVNHNVVSVGAILSDAKGAVGITGDTAPTDEIWTAFRNCSDLKAVLVECAFPDELGGLAEASRHLTPSRLFVELEKLNRSEVPVYVINIKSMYMEKVVEQLSSLHLPNLSVLEIGREYDL